MSPLPLCCLQVSLSLSAVGRAGSLHPLGLNPFDKPKARTWSCQHTPSDIVTGPPPYFFVLADIAGLSLFFFCRKAEEGGFECKATRLCPDRRDWFILEPRQERTLSRVVWCGGLGRRRGFCISKQARCDHSCILWPGSPFSRRFPQRTSCEEAAHCVAKKRQTFVLQGVHQRAYAVQKRSPKTRESAMTLQVCLMPGNRSPDTAKSSRPAQGAFCCLKQKSFAETSFCGMPCASQASHTASRDARMVGDVVNQPIVLPILKMGWFACLGLLMLLQKPDFFSFFLNVEAFDDRLSWSVSRTGVHLRTLGFSR